MGWERELTWRVLTKKRARLGQQQGCTAHAFVRLWLGQASRPWSKQLCPDGQPCCRIYRLACAGVSPRGSATRRPVRRLFAELARALEWSLDKASERRISSQSTGSTDKSGRSFLPGVHVLLRHDRRKPSLRRSVREGDEHCPGPDYGAGQAG